MELTPTHKARESNPTESDSRALPVMSIQFTKMDTIQVFIFTRACVYERFPKETTLEIPD